MALTLHPAAPGAGIGKDRPDYTIYSGDWAVGRIYETRAGPDRLRWFWSFTVTCPMTRSDRVSTLEEPRRAVRDRLAAMAGVGEAAGDAVAPEHEFDDRPVN